MNSLPKTVTRQRHGCDLNPGPTAPESKHASNTVISSPAWLLASWWSRAWMLHPSVNSLRCPANINSGGFRGRPSRLPPPLGNGPTDAVTILLIKWQCYCVMATPRFWSFYCKTCTPQNTQNDCHQGLSHSWGSLQRFPTPFSWFKGDATSKEKGRGEGTQIPGSTPDQQHTDMKTRDSHTS